MTMRKVDQRYLDQLSKRQSELDDKIRQGEQKQKEVSRIFLEHVRGELDLLLTEKDKMAQRNELYLGEIKNYTKEFNRVMPELLEAEEKLHKAKLQYQRAVEKGLK